MGHSSLDPAFQELRPYNEGRVLGVKRALKAQQVWAIRFWLDPQRRLTDRALFDFAIDRKLRGCEVVKVRIGDIVAVDRIGDRAVVVQQTTKRPVQLELVEPARKTLPAGESILNATALRSWSKLASRFKQHRPPATMARI